MGRGSTEAVDLSKLAYLEPLSGRVLERSDAEQLASVLKALADPTRLRILSLIAGARDGQACITELVAPTGLAQPTVSHHVHTLREAGLLESEKVGIFNYFRLNVAGLGAIAELLTPPKRRGRKA